jgi:ketopantoate reductase
VEARRIEEEKERAHLESERLEKAEQTKRILSMKSENLNSLFDDFNSSQKREIEFLESCTYKTLFE